MLSVEARCLAPRVVGPSCFGGAVAASAAFASTSSPSDSPRLVLASGGKPRQKAVKRRTRLVETVRAAIAGSFEERLTTLRNKNRELLDLLKREEDRRRILVKEHHLLSAEVENLQAQARDDQQEVELKRSIDANAAALVHQESIRRLEERHKLALASAESKHELALRAASLDIDRLTCLTNRLRSERNAARADSLRYNKERNAANAELLDLRAQQSRAAVLACTRPVFERK